MKKAILIILLLIATSAAISQNRDIHIVFIGNSITYGSKLENKEQEAAPVKAVEYLRQQPGIRNITFSNQGVSGKTTVDFLPVSETYFPKVREAALISHNNNSQLVFSIMLGTNDSAEKGPNGSPVSPQQYYTNMKVIIDELLSLYPDAIIVINRPIWYSTNTHNRSVYLKKGLERLNTYLPMIERLVTDYSKKKPMHVYLGDTKAYAYFEQNYLETFTHEEGEAGTFFLHPNKAGAESLGRYWAEAIYNILKR